VFGLAGYIGGEILERRFRGLVYHLLFVAAIFGIWRAKYYILFDFD